MPLLKEESKTATQARVTEERTPRGGRQEGCGPSGWRSRVDLYSVVSQGEAVGEGTAWAGTCASCSLAGDKWLGCPKGPCHTKDTLFPACAMQDKDGVFLGCTCKAGATGGRQGLGERTEPALPQSLRRNQPCRLLAPGLLVSITVREYMPVVLNHLVDDDLVWQPQVPSRAGKGSGEGGWGF